MGVATVARLLLRKNVAIGTVMNPILGAIADRRSIRQYQSRPVEPEKIAALLEAARLAPSSINLQHFRAIVVDSPDDLAAARAAAYNLPAIASAPLVLVCLADLAADDDLAERAAEVGAVSPRVDPTTLRSGTGRKLTLKMGRDWALVNAAIATQNIVVQATSMGLGTCWNHHCEHHELRAHFALPAHIEVLTLLAVGYAAEEPAPRPRRASVLWERARR